MEESTNASANGSRHGRSYSTRFAKDTTISGRSEETNAQLQWNTSGSEGDMSIVRHRGNLLLQYDRLQAQERDVIREMFNLQGQPMSHVPRWSIRCSCSPLTFLLCFSRPIHRPIWPTIRKSNWEFCNNRLLVSNGNVEVRGLTDLH